MASSRSRAKDCLLVFAAFSSTFYAVLPAAAFPGFGVGCSYDAIFSFGDSLADTGNLLHSAEAAAVTLPIANLPYGETFFGQPTGRCSNGRLIVDFIAELLGVPLLPPYLADPNGGRAYSCGVNFAVAGATALNASFFQSKNISGLWTTNSLNVQLGWFHDNVLPALCSTEAECRHYLKSSLFLVGEIGGNDYNYPFFQGKSIDEVKTYVLDVVNTITAAVQSLIKLGAVVLMVPGNLPIGCSTSYLTVFQSKNASDYDPQTGCLTSYNEFAVYHNALLQQSLQRLRELHPHATIIYVDYYNAAMGFFEDPHKFGFENVLSACCGQGGPYNFNFGKACGQPGIKACEDPSTYLNWDGIHLTEKAYEWIAAGILTGLFAHPPLGLPPSCRW